MLRQGLTGQLQEGLVVLGEDVQGQASEGVFDALKNGLDFLFPLCLGLLQYGLEEAPGRSLPEPKEQEQEQDGCYGKGRPKERGSEDRGKVFHFPRGPCNFRASIHLLPLAYNFSVQSVLAVRSRVRLRFA